jgi:hypothetical protein
MRPNKLNARQQYLLNSWVERRGWPIQSGCDVEAAQQLGFHVNGADILNAAEIVGLDDIERIKRRMSVKLND